MHFFLLGCVLTKCILCFSCTSILCVCGWWDVSCCSSCFLSEYCLFSGPRHHTNAHTLPTPPRWPQPLTPTPHLQTDTSGVRLGPPWSPSRVARPPSLGLAGGRLAHPECRPICSAGAGGLPGAGGCGKRSCPKVEPLNRSEFRPQCERMECRGGLSSLLGQGKSCRLSCPKHHVADARLPVTLLSQKPMVPEIDSKRPNLPKIYVKSHFLIRNHSRGKDWGFRSHWWDVSVCYCHWVTNCVRGRSLKGASVPSRGGATLEQEVGGQPPGAPSSPHSCLFG